MYARPSPRRGVRRTRRPVLEREFGGAIVRAIDDEHLALNAGAFEPFQTPVDERCDRDRLVERGDNEGNLGIGTVVIGLEELDFVGRCSETEG